MGLFLYQPYNFRGHVKGKEDRVKAILKLSFPDRKIVFIQRHAAIIGMEAGYFHCSTAHNRAKK